MCGDVKTTIAKLRQKFLHFTYSIFHDET